MDFSLRISNIEHIEILLEGGADPNVPWSQLATAIDKPYESEVGPSNYQNSPGSTAIGIHSMVSRRSFP